MTNVVQLAKMVGVHKKMFLERCKFKPKNKIDIKLCYIVWLTHG